MKLMITAAAIALAAAAAPAAAQYGPQSKPPETAAPAAQEAAAAAQKPVKVSNKAAKAIVALQTAVNKGDYSNLAALVAAAQAVASTPDDKYAIAELQLKAAVAQKNDAAKAEEAVISAADSRVEVLVIPTNEELVVAREVKHFLENKRN